MKKILILFILFNSFLLSLLGGLIFLAEAHPLRPGDFFYGVQQQAEQWRLELTAGPPRQTDVALSMVEHRLADLAEADESCCLEVAITAFDQALNETVVRIEPASVSGKDRYYDRFKSLLVQSEVILAGLEESGQVGPTAELISMLTRKITALQLANSQEEMLDIVPAEISFVAAAAIPFLAQDVDHDLYPLTGAHAELECTDCHPSGEYSDTPTECQGCHTASMDNLYALVLYPNHFDGACSDCHLDESWAPYQFDHGGVIECQSCHISETPAAHYPGACLLCHIDVVDWEQAAYVHADVTECRTCHLADTPRHHYVRPDALVASVGLQSSALPQQTPTSCINCHHNTSDWTNVSFDHSGFDDCVACHQQEDRPANHYQGQCSNCHTIAGWDQAWFNHNGFDICQKCHASQEQDHYLENCSTCHTTKNWQLIAFDHTGDDTCAACHLDQAPTGHYPAQCADCHSSDSWREVMVDHTGFDECEDCHSQAFHYPGLCSNCHITTNWLEYTFDHTGFSDCKECHNRPDHDEWGQCSKCHNIEWWDDIDFEHTDMTNCIKCHEGEAPSDHFEDYKCSTCHNTDDWTDIDVDHFHLDDCQSCHTSPHAHWPDEYECSTCHDTNNWHRIDVDHSDFDDDECQSCHNPPVDHWSGSCATCHNTVRWNFVHPNSNNCESCHNPPTGHYASFNCVNCHISTTDWYDLDFDHTANTRCPSCHRADIPENHNQRGCTRCHNTDDWNDVVTR